MELGPWRAGDAPVFQIWTNRSCEKSKFWEQAAVVSSITSCQNTFELPTTRKKERKKKRKKVQHLSKSRNLRRRVFTFRISDIFERDTVALPNFISFTFFWLFSILQNCRTLYNDIHENFGPVCVRQMIYFCRISTPEEIYLTGHFQYVWLLKRFTVSLNLRLNQ